MRNRRPSPWEAAQLTPPASWLRRTWLSARIRLAAAFPGNDAFPDRTDRRPVWQVLTSADLPREERIEMGGKSHV